MPKSSIRSFDAYLKTRQQQTAEPKAADASTRVMKILASGPQPMSDLLQATGLNFTALADQLERMQEFGLVRSKDDAGGKTFELTDEGRKAAQLG